MMDKIIAQYLSQNKRLVVPDFGAFIRKDSGEVIFVEFLKKDDHVLNNLVRSAYSVDESGANQIIAKFISNIKHAGELGGGYVLEGIGIIRSSGGQYTLEYNPKLNVDRSQVARQAPQPEPEPKRPEPRQQQPAQTHRGFSPQRVAEERREEPPRRREREPQRPQQPQEREYYEEQPPQRGQRRAPEHHASDRRGGERDPYREDRGREQRDPYYREGGRQQPPRPPHPGQGPRDGRRPQRPPARRGGGSRGGGGKKRTDLIIVIAIIAALVAIGSIVFGILVNKSPVDSMRSTQPMDEIEQRLQEIEDKKQEKDTLSLDETRIIEEE